MKIKKGDTVLVLSGKDKGKKGKVLKTFPDTLMIVVEGVAIRKKHQRATQKFQGGIIERPAKLPVSRVIAVCPRCGKASRLSRKRICRSCGR
jgi:large subunit ribosomal protein L24